MMKSGRFLNLLQCIFPDEFLVECMGIGGHKYTTLARDRGDGVLVAPVFWWTNTGQIILLPNGIVSRHSPSKYVFFWQHANHEKRVIMSLQWPEFKTIDQYENLSPQDQCKLHDEFSFAFEG